MHIVKPVAGARAAALALALALLAGSTVAWAAPLFSKDAEGRIRPFKVRAMPLHEFVREYSSFTQSLMQVGGRWEEELKGTATLFVHEPIQPEALAELFHQVLTDNGFAAIDGPGNRGWVILRQREARDRPLPVYDSADYPTTSRLITVFHTLKYINADYAARFSRTFMPPNSRIIPASASQLVITDRGRNIRKMLQLLATMDTPEAGKSSNEVAAESARNRACAKKSEQKNEQRIERLVVEKLEIKEGGQKMVGGGK